LETREVYQTTFLKNKNLENLNQIEVRELNCGISFVEISG
jgi:hypothetical protein